MDFDEIKHQIEEFFNGKFEVKKFLGEGSFAKVYLVNHNYMDELMAMKIVKEPLTATTNKKDIFREVSLACHLSHENIISIYDAAEISGFEDGKNHAYFVMEYVSGGDLEQFLNSFSENNMFMPLNRSLDLVKQILKGLNTLHSANPPIIHRDLKPNNVLLSFNACGDIIIKISDFGFAKEVTTGISDIDIAGTRPYMAPEIFNKSISTRTDIYAVGVIFYQLLTNLYPYDVEEYSNEELIDLKPWQKTLNAPSFYNDKVFEDLDNIVLKCLDFNPENRYLDAGELLADVEKAIEKHKSTQIISQDNLSKDYNDEYSEYIINDSIKEAFRLAKCENKLPEAIELLESEVLQDYDIRKCYSETLRIWKSKRPDVKLISKAFTVNLKGQNYKLSCNFLNEAIAYNPSLKSRYAHYIDLWNIFIDLEKHGSLFKSVVLLESLMDRNDEIKKFYKDIIPILKTYSIEEIVVEAIRLVNSNNLMNAANLMEFAVVCDANIKSKYAYKLSLWKQNMKMHFKTAKQVKQDTIDYAIDLGTTDSVISYFNKGNPVIIKNYMTGDEFTPSAVLIDNQDRVQVGINARNAIVNNSPNAVSEFKQNMGFPIPFKFNESSRIMFPEELSAMVLKELRLSAFKRCGVDVEHAVICVPANSNPLKTKAINDAANIAGFRSHNLILEPIAVSIAYNLRKDNAYWMIYDLGGGTFNVTIIHDNGGEIEKFATNGLDNLGGNSFDWKIVNDLFRPKIAYDLNLDDFRQDNPKYLEVFSKLKNASEVAKKELSKNECADISIDNLFEDYDFNYNLMKEDFKKSIEPLVKYTFKLCMDLLNECSLGEENIEKLILVGGSCLSPVVRELLSDEFDIEITSDLNPLTVVSMGAAIYAGSLEKPSINIKKEKFSVILSNKNNRIKGKVFCLDNKFSFLDYSIEFKNNQFSSGKIPLDIDSTFNIELPNEELTVNLYRGNTKVTLDEKSPATINGDSTYIPFLRDSFSISDNDFTLKELFNQYLKLLKEVEWLDEYSYYSDKDLINYIGRLFEIAQKDNSALNQCSIYLNYLKSNVEDLKRDFRYSVLLENVENKMKAIKENGLFEMDDDYENYDLNELEEFHSDLIEKYVLLNRDNVIEECFFNLKFEGVYTNNEKLAAELIEKANVAFADNDYVELFGIISLLYELDERD
ncbi:Hsp70 family protein [Methanobrevibacter millerae]|uniref:Protein kinase domain-containing protein n=1 Tax=Methanobrevibacter millerae TaxID=230361 RepID=A0A1G5VRT5_9EURY|nr:Hsp70 family protein [Methanobrevibacter millerae]SDA48424.1 Protein kinase domain-containing protein [Methanobrevibacter millerae]